MPFTYTSDPSSSDKDWIRFEIQDTDPNAPLLQDAEILFTVNDEAGPTTPRTPHGLFSAAARCCEVLARRFAAQADTVVGSLQTTYSKTAENYAARAKELRAKAAGMGAPYVGGQSLSEKDADRVDSDRVQPRFRRGQVTNSLAGDLSVPNDSTFSIG